ncbi:MAG: hypothetical protein HY961_02290 [Ignavibacteriae bacterium]|nr:hypothetical protein [Ignavibacteriota bacterium]
MTNTRRSLTLLTIFFFACSFARAAERWSSTNGPFTGFVYAQAIDQQGNLYACTGGHGVFVADRSTRCSWQERNAGLSTHAIYAIAVDVTGTVFVGTDDGIFSSTNGGEYWTRVSDGLSNTIVSALAVSPSGMMFAGTLGGGIFRSENKGIHWTHVGDGLNADQILSLTIDSRGSVYAGTDGAGVFRSSDNGTSWTRMNHGLSNMAIISLAVDAYGTLFAGTRGNGAFRSSTQASLWSEANNGIGSASVYALATSANGVLYAGTDKGAFASSNGGKAWFPIGVDLPNQVVLSLAVDASMLLAGTGGSGVFRLQ